MAKKRIFTAVLATETNTFSPIHVDIRAFEASLLARPGEHSDLPTLCSAVIPIGREMAEKHDWNLIEGTAAWADPAGMVSQQTFESLRDEILEQLKEAMPLDAVVLGLHGAMVADGYDDAEGDLLSRARKIVGPDVPVLATVDPHSHLTKKRLAAATAFVAFKEFPHIDFVDRAEDIWHLTRNVLAGTVNPKMSVYDCKMIDVFPTSQEPMRSYVDDLYTIEAKDEDILSLSVIHGFMAGDVPEMGTKIIAITNDKPKYGYTVAKRLGEKLYALRGKVRSPEIAVDDALDRAIGWPGPAPAVVADMWDNPGGGTAGDGTIILAECIKRRLDNVCFGSIWDPIAVQICHAAGEGAEIALRFGGKSAPMTGDPIDAKVKVLKNTINAAQMFGGGPVPIGDASLIQLGGIKVILNSTRAQCFDTSLFKTMGVDPNTCRILVVKSTNHFHDSFSRITSEIIYCSAGAPYPSDPRRTTYKKAPRDIWPINETV